MRVLKLLAAAGLTILLAIAVLILVPPLLGYQRYVITGGSMGGALPRGSIAYDEVVPTEHIRVGDVITYRPPTGDRLLTHRVVWIGRKADGVRRYRTRGDASPAADPKAVLLPNDGQARMVFHVPLVGYLVAALSVRAVRIAAIGVPALAIAATAFAGPWRRRRRRKRRGRQAMSFGGGGGARGGGGRVWGGGGGAGRPAGDAKTTRRRARACGRAGRLEPRAVTWA